MNKPSNSKLSAEDIKSLIRDLPPAEKALLVRDASAISVEAMAVNDRIVYGYRCRRCNEVGLEFLGDKFLDPSSGREIDEIPLNVPLENLPWKSERGENRRTPKCRNCSSMLTTESDGCLIVKYVVNIKAWKADKAKALSQFNKSVGLRFRGDRASPYVEALDGSGVHSMSVPTEDGKIAKLTEPANAPTSMKGLETAMAEKGIKL